MTAIGLGYLSDYILWHLLYVSLLIHTWVYFQNRRRRRNRRQGYILGNVLVFFGFAGFIALIAETYMRFFSVCLEPFGVSIPSQRWFAKFAPLNSFGYRDSEWSTEKPAGVRRIAFVGDSFTFGWGIEQPRNRFSDLIQTRFERSKPGKVQVLNVSKPGWGSGAELSAINEIIRQFAVDEIVLGYVLNDLEQLLPRSIDFDPVNPPEPVFFNHESSCVLDYFYRTLVVPRLPSVQNYFDWLADGYADPEAWRRHEDQLGHIVALCREKKVTLRVALLPFLKTRGEKFHPDTLHQQLCNWFETNHVPVVDLRESIAALPPDDLVINPRDAHPNEKAHALFADLIWKSFYAE